MMAMAHATHGKLPWAALFQPAVELAEKGFPISPRLYTTLGFLAKRMCLEKAVAAHYLSPTARRRTKARC
jgi:gamma-glutamyltranspeptidase/glutathione hydrolase